MNEFLLAVRVISVLPELVLTVEKVFKGTRKAGRKKKQMALEILSESIPDFHRVAGATGKNIDRVVAAMNATGGFGGAQ